MVTMTSAGGGTGLVCNASLQPDWSQLLDLSWPGFKSGTEWHRMTVLQRSDSGLERKSESRRRCARCN